MKFIFVLFLFLSVLVDGLNKASRINNSVQEAAVYFNTGQYEKAVRLYQYLADSLGVKDEQLLANLAHAQFLNQDSERARKNYTRLSKSKNPTLQAIASTQLGLIYFQKKNPERALYHFKKAIIQNPANDTARFNYELLQKYLATNPTSVNPPEKGALPDHQPKSQPQENSFQAGMRPSGEGNTGTTNDPKTTADNPNSQQQQKSLNKERGSGKQQSTNSQQKKQNGNYEALPTGARGNDTEGLSGDGGENINTNDKGESEVAGDQAREMQTLRIRLQKSGISPEKAKMLLESMRQAEMQYLQQVPRKAKLKNKKTYPDW